MPAVLFKPDKPAIPPAEPLAPIPAILPAPDIEEPPVPVPAPAPLPSTYDPTFLTPIKHIPLRRSRVPRTVGVGGIFRTPKPNLPASIFRGDDNPLSPSPDDYDETAAFLQDDNEFDLASELALAEHAENSNQLLLPPFDPDAVPPSTPQQHRPPAPEPDLGEGLLSPPQIVWKRHYPPGAGMTPGPVARPEGFGSPYFATGSPAPTSTVPSTPTVEASASATATSATAGMEQAETQGAGSDYITNPAGAPLLVASIALSVVLGVLLVGLATCGIVKSCRKKRRGPDDGDEKDRDPPSPTRTLPSMVRLPSSSSNMAFSASPSFATAASFHTAHSINDIQKMASAPSHPQSILITSRSAQSLTGSTHTRRISFVENPMPINSIEDLHRQLYAPPGWQPGMPLPLAYMQAHGYQPYAHQYQVAEADAADAYTYGYEPDLHSLSSAGQMSSVTWSATPLDTISEEGSHCGSDESAGSLPYMRQEQKVDAGHVPVAEQQSQQYQQQQQPQEQHAFVLPTIPSLADDTLEDAMRDRLSELESQGSANDHAEPNAAASPDADALSRRSSATSIRHDADSTFSSMAPGTPRASTSEPSLRSLSFHSANEDLEDEEELAYGVVGGYGYAYLAQRSPGGGWIVQAPPSPKTPVSQKRVTIATSPTADAMVSKCKGKRRRRRANRHGNGKTPYPGDKAGAAEDAELDASRPGSRLDFRPDSMVEARQVEGRSFDSVYGLSLPHEESVLGALLMLEENDMDARRAAFSPKSSQPLQDISVNRFPTHKRVKRSKSIPTKLFGRSKPHLSDSTPSGHGQSQGGERNTEYFGHFKRAFRAMRSSDQTRSLHLGDEVLPLPPSFRRFSGADWDELDELDPYYSEAEGGDVPDDARDGAEGSPMGDDRNSRQLSHLSSHFGLSEAHFTLDDFDFPEPANHLPHIHITSH